MFAKNHFASLSVSVLLSSLLLLTGCGGGGSNSEDAPHLDGTETQDIITYNILVDGDGSGSVDLYSSYELTEPSIDGDQVTNWEYTIECPIGGYCIYQLPRLSPIIITANVDSASYIQTSIPDCDLMTTQGCSMVAQKSGDLIFQIQLNNLAPVTADDTVTTQEDSPITLNILNNDYDVNHDPLSIASISNSENGTTEVLSDGNIAFTPDANFNGTASVTYKVTDGSLESNDGNINITVTPVNDAPEAADDNLTTEEDTPISSVLTKNDTDIDGDALFIISLSSPQNGTVTLVGDDEITYTPNADFVGADFFTYTINDGSSAESTGEVSVNVGQANDPPTAFDDNYSTNEDVLLTTDLTLNDIDVDDDGIFVSTVGAPMNGTLALNPDGTISYTPNVNFNGNDQFSYTLSDTLGETDNGEVFLSILPVNDDPLATDDSAATTEETPVEIDVRLNDSDTDGDSLSISEFSQPSNGIVTLSSGVLTYTPDDDYVGVDSFTYVVTDGNDGYSTATVSVDTGNLNDDPVSEDDTANTLEDVSVMVFPLENDIDLDTDVLSVSEYTLPTNGTVTLVDSTSLFYEPDPDFNGQDGFIYTVIDGNGGLDRGLVSITIAPVNDAPSAADDLVLVDPDTTAVIDVLSNDPDIDGDLLVVTLSSLPLPTSNGSADITEEGLVSYTPNPGYLGQDSFSYTVDDGNGGVSIAEVLITVGTGNQAPVVVDDQVAASANVTTVIPVLINDYDPNGDILTITSAVQPVNGAITVNPDNSIDYTPTVDFAGSDQFTYTADDGNGGSAAGTVSITVTLVVNQDPAAIDDSASAIGNLTTTIPVLGNDSDPESDSISVVSVTQPANGTAIINADSSIDYTPNTGYVGTDLFTYTLSDDNGGSSTATVTVDVLPLTDG